VLCFAQSENTPRCTAVSHVSTYLHVLTAQRVPGYRSGTRITNDSMAAHSVGSGNSKNM